MRGHTMPSAGEACGFRVITAISTYQIRSITNCLAGFNGRTTSLDKQSSSPPTNTHTQCRYKTSSWFGEATDVCSCPVCMSIIFN